MTGSTPERIAKTQAILERWLQAIFETRPNIRNVEGTSEDLEHKIDAYINGEPWSIRVEEPRSFNNVTFRHTEMEHFYRMKTQGCAGPVKHLQLRADMDRWKSWRIADLTAMMSHPAGTFDRAERINAQDGKRFTAIDDSELSAHGALVARRIAPRLGAKYDWRTQ